MSQPQNLPELLQARRKLGLFNWGKRTLIWSMALALLASVAPGLRFLLIGWLIFSALSLAILLIGLKVAGALKTGTISTFPGTATCAPGEPRDVGGTRPEFTPQEEFPGRHAHAARPAVSDEIIEIEAEVLPPEQKG
jgi:hypothetical protein